MSNLLPDRRVGERDVARDLATRWPAGSSSLPPLVHGSPYTRVVEFFRRHWWVLVVTTALCVSIGWVITQRMRTEYEATATLRLTESEAAIPGLKALEQLTSRGSAVNTEQAVLASRSMARAVVNALGLRIVVESPRRVSRDSLFQVVRVDDSTPAGRYALRADTDSTAVLEAPGAAPRQVRRGVAATVNGLVMVPSPTLLGVVEFEVVPERRAVNDLVESLRISRLSREADILLVRYRGSDPALTERVPNTLVTAYVERRSASRKTAARSTVTFLRGQLDTLQRQLGAAEDSLRRFKESGQLVAMDQQTAVSVSRMAELQAERNQTAAELTALEATVDSAQREAGTTATPSSVYRPLLAFPTLLRTALIPTLLQSLTTLENERSTLLVRRLESDRDVLALSRQINEIEGQIAGIVRTYATGLREQVRAYDRTLAQSNSALRQIPAKEVALAQYRRSTTVLSELSSLLQARLKEAEIAKAVDDASAEIVDLAERPLRPVSPRPAANLALGAIVGLVLGSLLAWLRELASRTKVQTRDELESDTGGLPVLGIVPRLGSSAGRGRSVPSNAPILDLDLHSAGMEAYRTMRTSLAFTGRNEMPQVLLVTSPTVGDGKSTSAANLAATFAQQGLRTLVIDADLRRGELHTIFSAAVSPGLSEVLSEGSVHSERYLQKLTVPNHGRIDLVSRGATPDSPAELLASPFLDGFLASIRPLYDRIVIDSPPVNVVADSLILCRLADGVVVVTRGGHTRREALRFALDQLASVRAPVLGTVLNGFDFRGSNAYGNEYDRYFQRQDAATPG